MKNKNNRWFMIVPVAVLLIVVAVFASSESQKGSFMFRKAKVQSSQETYTVAKPYKVNIRKSPPPAPVYISKAEFSQLIVNKLNVDTSAHKACAPDVVGQWYENTICYLVDNNMLSPFSDGMIRPGNYMNRAEAATFFVRSLIPEVKWYKGNEQFYNDVAAGSWYFQNINTLHVLNISDVNYGVDKGQSVQFNPAGTLEKNAALWWFNHL